MVIRSMLDVLPSIKKMVRVKLPEPHSRLILFVIREAKGCIYNLLTLYLTKKNRNRNSAH